ncbi:MAG: hypothetical protein ABSA16_13330 [Thermoguttaceae bacterium]
MSGSCRILTASMLIFHLMVGCCMHHAHACDDDDQSPPASVVVVPDDQCPAHQPDHSHHGRHDCQGVKCSFVRTTDDTVAKSLDQVYKAPAALLFNDVFAPSDDSFERHFFHAGRLLPPIRLYLANQVLLI